MMSVLRWVPHYFPQGNGEWEDGESGSSCQNVFFAWEPAIIWGKWLQSGQLSEVGTTPSRFYLGLLDLCNEGYMVNCASARSSLLWVITVLAINLFSSIVAHTTQGIPSGGGIF